MRLAAWSRRTHRWLGLFIGIQALLWMASGLYMTVFSIDIIHGDHLAQREVRPLAWHGPLADPAVLAARYPGMTRFKLKQLDGRPVYEIQHPGGLALADGVSGTPLPPRGKAQILAAALASYRGDGKVTALTLLAKAPAEMAARPAPLWRVDFDDRAGTSLYFSPVSGELLGKRHDLWRAFDFLWMLHIMDYAERENVNNLLLRCAALLGTLFGLSGAWLLFHTARRRKAA